MLSTIEFRMEWPVLVVAAVAAVAVLGGVVSYLLMARPLSWRWRTVLMGCRLVAVAAAMAVLLRPGRTQQREHVERATVAVVVDQTRSMTVSDADGRPRIDAVKAMLADAEPRLQELARQYDLERFVVDTELRPVEQFSYQPKGKTTNLGDPLRKLLARATARRYAAVLVIGDGAQNVGLLDPVQMGMDFRHAGAAVHTVGVGLDEASSATRDVVAKSIEAPQRVFVNNDFAGRARFTLRGYKDTAISLKVSFGDKVVDTIEVTPTDEVVNVQPSFRCTADEEGVHKLSVRVDPLEGELSAENNEVSTFVRVAEGELKLLYLEGRFRHEARFLARTLSTMKDMELEQKLLVGRGHDPAELPQTPQAWKRYAVVILGDLGSSAFTDESMTALEQAVSDGLGLVMIGGIRNFGVGFADTPVAPLVPVTFAEPGQFQGNYGLKVNPRYGDHFILQVDEKPTDAVTRIEALPKLEGGVAVAGVSPLAKVLLTDDKPAKRPILVVSDYGKAGRTAAVLTDTTWRWSFSPEPEHKETYQRIWKQLVLWLAGRDKLADDQAWLVLDRTRCHLGTERVTMNAFAETAKGVPIDDAVVHLEIKRLGGDETASMVLSRTGDSYQGSYDPPAVGDYEVTMTARRGGEVIGTQTENFRVYLADIEMDEPQANTAMLKQLAEASGGMFARVDGFDDIVKQIENTDANITVTTTSMEPLWDNFVVLGIFLGALAAEWIIRKAKGLI